jgi:hypothetical protein
MAVSGEDLPLEPIDSGGERGNGGREPVGDSVAGEPKANAFPVRGHDPKPGETRLEAAVETKEDSGPRGRNDLVAARLRIEKQSVPGRDPRVREPHDRRQGDGHVR